MNENSLDDSDFVNHVSFVAANAVYDFSYRYIDPCLVREIELFAHELQRRVIQCGCAWLNGEITHV